MMPARTAGRKRQLATRDEGQPRTADRRIGRAPWKVRRVRTALPVRQIPRCQRQGTDLRLADPSARATVAAVANRVIYLIGGPGRVGKSTLAARLLRRNVAWLPTDIIRTVLRRVVPDLDALDQGLADDALVAESMYPHIEQAAEVCAEEHDAFLLEGFDIAPSFCPRLHARLAPTEIRACFLGHGTFTSSDLANYRGPKPQHEGTMSATELAAASAWIRTRSHQLRAECNAAGLHYIDVSERGFEEAMNEAERLLLG